MGQEPGIKMNPATTGKSNTRASGYHQKALIEIRNSLLPFANGGGTNGYENYSSAASTISTISTTSGVSSASGISNTSNGTDKDPRAFLALRESLEKIIPSDVSWKLFYVYIGRLVLGFECLMPSMKEQNDAISIENGIYRWGFE